MSDRTKSKMPNVVTWKWYRVLDLVPKPMRSRWPMKRWFWQQAELDAAFEQARELKKHLGGTDE